MDLRNRGLRRDSRTLPRHSNTSTFRQDMLAILHFLHPLSAGVAVHIQAVVEVVRSLVVGHRTLPLDTTVAVVEDILHPEAGNSPAAAAAAEDSPLAEDSPPVEGNPAAGLGCAELAVGAGCEPPAGELVDEVVGVPVGEVLDEVVGELADGAAGQADVDLVDLVEAPGGELAAVDPGVFEASRLVGFPEVWHPVDVLQVWHLAGVPVA